MLTNEDWQKLKVGDVIYLIRPSKMRFDLFKVESIKESTKKAIKFKDRKAYLYVSNFRSESCFTLEKQAILYLIELAERTKVNMNNIIDKYKKQLESLENGR